MHRVVRGDQLGHIDKISGSRRLPRTRIDHAAILTRRGEIWRRRARCEDNGVPGTLKQRIDGTPPAAAVDGRR